jgi:hypothetical protein
MTQMHSQFVTDENEQTSVAVTRDGDANSWGVTVVTLRLKNGMWSVHNTITFGAYVDEQGAYELYAKMANALEYRGHREIRV